MGERLTDARVVEIADTYLGAAPLCLRDADGEQVDITEEEIESLAAEVRDLRAEVGRLRGQNAEAAAILRDGTDYDRLHVAGILDPAPPPVADQDCATHG